MAGIPDFDQYFEQFQLVVTLELRTQNLEPISLGINCMIFSFLKNIICSDRSEYVKQNY